MQEIPNIKFVNLYFYCCYAGIFANTYVTWDDLVNETNDKPHLVDMASQAVKFLQHKADDKGFFLMIEGGKIDQAHHNGKAVRALSETLAFDKAVEEVLSLVDLEDTLVIVTADHAHTMSIGGYAGRVADITGVVVEGDNTTPMGEDGSTFTVLSYGNGPGYMQYNGTGVGNFTKIDRHPMKKGDKADIAYKQASAAPCPVRLMVEMMLVSGQEVPWLTCSMVFMSRVTLAMSCHMLLVLDLRARERDAGRKRQVEPRLTISISNII